jgi:hypothetical protein
MISNIIENIKKGTETTYDIGNLVSGLVQAQQNRLMESQTPS